MGLTHNFLSGFGEADFLNSPSLIMWF